jgi:hypothetical protein
MDALPDELRQFEEELIASRSSEPPTELRERVLGEVQHALAVELRASRRQSRWAFAASVAASVLVWMNMSISATTATDCRVPLASSAAEMDRLTAAIHELLPELSAENARRQALIHRSNETLSLRLELPLPVIAQGPHNALNSLSE